MAVTGFPNRPRTSPSARLQSIVAAVTVLSGLASAAAPAPISFAASNWAGIDGNWSTFEFSIGDPPQLVHVLASTALSELWAVGEGGCIPDEPQCQGARGGVFTSSESLSWFEMGTWELGLDYLGNRANGNYGLDTMISSSPISGSTLNMAGTLVATINTTDYFLGTLGLGITRGNFGGSVIDSPLTQAVSGSGLIPSYSYGYTAGAHYRDMPASLTWGGYDLARFVDHQETFALGSSDMVPRVLVRGIEINTGEDQEKPSHWNSSTTALSDWDRSFTAIIDTTTPFLWLPNDVCDKFANALNLTYNDTFDLYTLDNEQYGQLTDLDGFSFVFTLSGSDNQDNFGDPLDTPGVVNITLPARAFVDSLQYPFMDEAIGYGEPAVPYFSLRRSGSNNTLVIGRSFLQESYLVAQYDMALFSIHQAKFPENPEVEVDIQAIEQPENSPYPPPTLTQNRGLSKGQMAGVVVGAVGIVAIIFFGFWYFRQKRTQRDTHSSDGMDLDKKSTLSPTPDIEPKVSPLTRILTKIKRRPLKGGARGLPKGQELNEVENHEIYEMPAPRPPVELNVEEDHGSMGDDNRLGLGSRERLSAYDQAQKIIDWQLAGPVPEYSPPATGMMPPPEKSLPVEHPVISDEPASKDQTPDNGHLTLRHQPSFAPVSPAGPESSRSGSVNTSPSPISPRGEWTNQFPEASSPTDDSIPPPVLSSVAAPDFPEPGRIHIGEPFAESAPRRQLSQNPFQNTLTEPALQAHNFSLQRSQTDPLNYKAQFPHDTRSRPRVNIPKNPPVTNFTIYPDDDLESLGSNFTEEEEKIQEMVARMRMQEMQAQGLAPPPDSVAGPSDEAQTSASFAPPQIFREFSSRNTQGRIQSGSELIHVPHLAEKRYSWEEDRT